MSAMRNCSAWKSARREPNCLRSRHIGERAVEAELRAAERAGGDVEAAAVEPGHGDLEALALSPTDWRPERGILEDDRAVGCAFQPSFFSCAPKERPGVSFSTTRQEMPFGAGRRRCAPSRHRRPTARAGDELPCCR
jgi:hypothetical protein